MRRRTILSIYSISFACLSLHARDVLHQAGEVALSKDATKAVQFRSTDKPVFLWFEVRSDGQAEPGVGKRNLKISLDGRIFTPGLGKVLNKTEIVYRKAEQIKRKPLYDAERQSWFVPTAGEFPTDRAQLCHYFDYLIQLELEPGKHTLEFGVADAGETTVLRLRSVQVWEQKQPFIVSSLDWDENLYSWQTPQADMLSRPLRMSGCAGEFEPITLNLFALRDLKDVHFRWTDFRGQGGNLIPAKNLKTFWLNQWRPPPAKDAAEDISFETPDSAANAVIKGEEVAADDVDREILNEPVSMKRDPEATVTVAPDERGVVTGARNPIEHRGRSPEMLVPLTEMRPAVPAKFNARFYLDLRIPHGQAPGLYKSTLHVVSNEEVLATLPLECEVLPFKLDPPRQTYWMWRLQWTPVWQPENVACLRDIREHGYTGLARTCGANFSFRISKDGEVTVNSSGYRKLKTVLEETGLALEVADTSVAHGIVRAALAHLGLKLDPDQYVRMQELTDLRKHFEKKYLQKALKEEADSSLGALADGISIAAGEETDDSVLDELDDAPKVDKKQVIRERAARDAARMDARMRSLIVQGFRKVKEECGKIGITMRVFPVDEPDGTPWRRLWTTFAAGLAKEAGLETFSTLNSFTWKNNIDHAVFGGKIVRYYSEPKIVTHRYEKEVFAGRISDIGRGSRGRGFSMYRGELDEVRIYERPLAEKEILRQHERPATRGLVQYLSFDEPGSKAYKFSGKPKFVPCKLGNGIQFGGQQFIELATEREFKDGWSISMWFKGWGPLFGRAAGFSCDTASIWHLEETDKGHPKWQRKQLGGTDRRFWAHLTVTFDPRTKTIKSFIQDQDVRHWFRENVRWTYMQVRLRWPNAQRFQTGLMSWHYGNYGKLRGITTFGYDWNNRTCVVVPRNGDRFRNDGVWYRTIGWEGCREGIDDARYLQTLVNALVRKGLSESAAIRKVSEIIAPVSGQWAGMKQVRDRFGTYGAFRLMIVHEILALKE
ncbi:MAG: hypothetical protein QGF00_12785 [Planctomycetota bacterium]|nr:hypothetical protein [Planctomycetota bacterium]MDP7250473.1 hypothetical protein [Planctomycetota bacterium]